MTNRDRLNKMSDEQLANEMKDGRCSHCNYHFTNLCGCSMSGTSCIKGITKWLESEVEQTADEMFEELGYVKKEAPVCKAYYKTENDIYIGIYKDYSYFKMNYMVSGAITEKEDKAIHKKIEELKKEE